MSVGRRFMDRWIDHPNTDVIDGWSHALAASGLVLDMITEIEFHDNDPATYLYRALVLDRDAHKEAVAAANQRLHGIGYIPPYLRGEDPVISEVEINYLPGQDVKEHPLSRTSRSGAQAVDAAIKAWCRQEAKAA